jgi:hypothetical protein
MSAWNVVKPRRYVMLVLGDCGVVPCLCCLAPASHATGHARTVSQPRVHTSHCISCQQQVVHARLGRPLHIVRLCRSLSTLYPAAALYRSEINDAHCSRPKTPQPNLIAASTLQPTYLSLSVCFSEPGTLRWQPLPRPWPVRCRSTLSRVRRVTR